MRKVPKCQLGKLSIERVYATSNIFSDLGAVVTEKIYPNMAHTIIDDELIEANKILRG
jgi:phospholipase/carboxylesterase